MACDTIFRYALFYCSVFVDCVCRIGVQTYYENHYFWGIPRLSGVKMGIIVRIGLALLVTIGSIALAWTLLSSHKNARAIGIVETSTTQKPWGVAFDKSGHVWVAEPGCLPQPVCSPVVSGSIGEFNTSDDSKVQEYSSAPSTYMPFSSL